MLTTVLSIPSPSSGRLVPRPAAAARLRAGDHPRHRRRDLDRRAALGRARRHGRRDPGPRDLGGPVRPGRRPDLPRAHRQRALLRRRAATRSRRSTSGAAASASGARSRSARSAWSSAPGARASGCCRCSTRWRPASWSPRRSAAGATGSTRSCSASRPTCRGASRSTPTTAPTPATRPATTFHPTFLYECLWCLAGFARADLGRPPVPPRPRPGRRALRHGLHGRPRLDRDAADRQRRARGRRRAAASTSGPRSSCSSPPLVYSWSSARRHPGREDQVYVDGAGPDDGTVATSADRPTDRDGRVSARRRPVLSLTGVNLTLR